MGHLSAEDRRLLAQSLSAFVSDTWNYEALRQALKTETGRVDGWWAQLAQDIGVLGLAQDEAVGGLGGDVVDLGLVAEVFGEHLVNEPLLPSIALAGELLRGQGGGVQALLEQVVTGQSIVAPALFERGSRYHAGTIETLAQAENGGWRLTGRKVVVRAAPWSDHLLVSALVGGQIAVFLVPSGAAGLSQIAYPTYDGQRAADVVMAGVWVGADARLSGVGIAEIERALDLTTLVQASEALGVMRHMLAATREHVTTRQQFGQPLSRFQVIQHRMADMAMALARAEAVTAAGLKQVEITTDAARLVSGIKLAVDAAALIVAEGTVQLHGAIGMTEELSVSHGFKRLTLIQTEFGDTAYHQARIGDRLAA